VFAPGLPCCVPWVCMELSALCLHGTGRLLDLLLCGAWMRAVQRKKTKTTKFTTESKDEILNLRFVAFL